MPATIRQAPGPYADLVRVCCDNCGYTGPTLFGSCALAIVAIEFDANGPVRAVAVAVFFLACAVLGHRLQRRT